MIKKRFEALDGFRGLCALCVAIFHMPYIEKTFTEFSFFKGSAIFVDFFFILSGFVLTHGYAFKKNLTFWDFAKSRFFRLYPLHIFTLGVVLCMLSVRGVAINFNVISSAEAAFSGANSISELIPNLLLVHAWSSHTTGVSFNYPSWSISIEFYMYFIFYLTLIITKNFKALVWSVVFIVSFILLYEKTDLLMTNVLRGNSNFFGGCLIYLVFTKINTFKMSVLLGTFIEIILLIGVYYIVQSTIEYRGFIATVLFFFTILFFAFEAGHMSRLLVSRPLQELGKLSYSIYMVHALILLGFSWLLSLSGNILGYNLLVISDVLNNLFLLFLLLIIVLTSRVTYQHIEVRGQNFGRRITSKKAKI
jgi:peptidoglycan/LPS O-acetylase OafA/YrhL